MDCERFDKNSMDLLYGELDELSEAATMRHLHHCTRCRGIWGHLRTTRELSALPLEDPGDELLVRIVEAEKLAHASLPIRERFSRTVSVLAGYAMRPQLTMAALLVLMVGSSLIFVRVRPSGHLSEDVRVVERGIPSSEGASSTARRGSHEFAADPDGSQRLGAPDDDDPESADLPSGQSKARKEDAEKRQRTTYADAMTAYQHGRYAEAERLFSEVASAGGSQAASAALHEGHAARNGSGCQRAAAIYDSIATAKAGGTIASEAAWHAASCYRAMGQTERAAAHYKNLAASRAFSARALQALVELEPKPNISSSANVPAPDAEARTKTADGVGQGQVQDGTSNPPAQEHPAEPNPSSPASPSPTTPDVGAAPKEPGHP